MAELFIAGAQRSGTTYLYNMLDSHPQVLMAKPVRPEPKFFLDKSKYAQGRDYYESLYYGLRSTDHMYIGEKSTSYIEYADVALKINSFYPQAKIIFILRDPVKRAYSNYRFSVENGIESLSFKDAISVENDRLKKSKFDSSVSPYAYVQRGHYMAFIQDYIDVFGKEKIKILIHEEFVSNISSITDLYSWLGLDARHMPDSYSVKVNNSTSQASFDGVDADLKKQLYSMFEKSNSELEECLGRRITGWPSN